VFKEFQSTNASIFLRFSRFWSSCCKACKISMETNVKFSHTKGVLCEDLTSYRRLIGCLLYLTITRTDISYSMQVLTQFMDQPRQTILMLLIVFYGKLKLLLVKIIFSFFFTFQSKAFCDLH
jgi:hypothetical protein